MLTRRELLAASVASASGSTLVDPLSRWLGAGTVGLSAPAEAAKRIGMEEVQSLEAATGHFAALEARAGGGLSREAAMGRLKYAVDLARYAAYDEAVGNRLLAAVAGLAGLVGWSCHDSGMAGPGQRYMVYGLQAAREAQVLCNLGRSSLPEVRSAVGLSFDLQAYANDEEQQAIARLAHRSIGMSEAELSAKASDAYLVLAREDRTLSADAEQRALHALAHIGGGYGRNKVMAQIRLARVHFVGGEPDQACDEGEQALEMAERVSSTMIRTRLRELLADAEPYRERPRVRQLREQVRVALEK